MKFDYALLLSVFNIIGIFAFAISGAAAGVKRQADLFGVAVLAFTASCCGGIIRDVLIGAVPPENITSWEPLLVSLAATMVTVLFFQQILVDNHRNRGCLPAVQ